MKQVEHQIQRQEQQATNEMVEMVELVELVESRAEGGNQVAVCRRGEMITDLLGER